MNFVDTALVLLILANFWLLASSRLASLIRAVGLQGFALGSLLVMTHEGAFNYRMLFFALLITGIKGVAFPMVLRWNLRKLNVRNEVEPYIGYSLSILAGIGGLALSFWVASRLPLPGPVASSLAVPVAFSTMLTGFFLIISRRKALTQVIGYLVAENGIYAFGAAAVHAASVWIELGVLLDLFVGVFVMGIAIHHINREFDSIDVDRFSSLKD